MGVLSSTTEYDKSTYYDNIFKYNPLTNTISFYTENTSLRIENPERNRRFPKGILGRAYESKNTRSDRPFKDL